MGVFLLMNDLKRSLENEPRTTLHLDPQFGPSQQKTLWYKNIYVDIEPPGQGFKKGKEVRRLLPHFPDLLGGKNYLLTYSILDYLFHYI